MIVVTVGVDEERVSLKDESQRGRYGGVEDSGAQQTMADIEVECGVGTLVQHQFATVVTTAVVAVDDAVVERGLLNVAGEDGILVVGVVVVYHHRRCGAALVAPIVGEGRAGKTVAASVLQ